MNLPLLIALILSVAFICLFVFFLLRSYNRNQDLILDIASAFVTTIILIIVVVFLVWAAFTVVAFFIGGPVNVEKRLHWPPVAIEDTEAAIPGDENALSDDAGEDDGSTADGDPGYPPLTDEN